MDIGDSFQNTTDGIFDFLPHLVGLPAHPAHRLHHRQGRRRHRCASSSRSCSSTGELRDSSASRYVDAVLPGASAANGIARVVFWLIFIFFITAAIGALGIPAATGFMNDVMALPAQRHRGDPHLRRRRAALGCHRRRGGRASWATPRPARSSATVAPAVIMMIAFFMILEQLQIAPEIVRIAFTAIMFALALGLALAFGLGGRDLAADLLRQARDKGSEAASQAKQMPASEPTERATRWDSTPMGPAPPPGRTSTPTRRSTCRRPRHRPTAEASPDPRSEIGETPASMSCRGFGVFRTEVLPTGQF